MELTKTATEIIEALNEANEKKPAAYDTTAEVKRVEGSTAWVHIPGGVDETPAALTIDAAVGDTVQIRVADGNAWITGNQTAPPTSDKTANEALKMAAGAAKTVERGLVSDTLYYLASDQDSGVTVDTPGWSEEPQEITEALPYLWIYHLYTYADGRTETTEPCIVGVYGPQGEQGEQGDPGDPGAPGVSVSKVEPQYYLSLSDSSATGGSWQNSLPSYVSGRFYWTRDKITYSNGTTDYSTATYSPGLTESVQLSYNTAQHFWTQTSGTTAVPNGAYVTEKTEASYKSSPSGGATLIQSDKVDIRVGSKTYSRFDGNGTHIYDGNGTAAANVLAEFTGSGATIKKSGTEIANLGYGSGKSETGATVDAPYYTLGKRATNSVVGNYSVAEGYDVTASGPISHAEGSITTASGIHSHAEGRETNATGIESHAEGWGTTAQGDYSHAEGVVSTATGAYAHAQNYGTLAKTAAQTAIGKFNTTASAENSNVAFIIGNGTRDGNRGDALSVTWAGAITAGGLPSGLLAEDVLIVDNLSVTTSTPTADGTTSVAKTGYTPIGVVGFRCLNASSSGINGDLGVISRAYLSGTNNATANYRVRNCGDATMKVRIYFTILYALS